VNTAKMKLRLAGFLTTTIVAGLCFLPEGQVLAAQQGTIEQSVNFRTAPDTEALIIRLLQEDEQVSIVEKVNQYWFKVRDKNGKIGYVSANSKYISTHDLLAEGFHGTVLAGVNLRTAPDTDSRIIRLLKRNENVSVIQKVNAYWYKVLDQHGSIGYVSANSKYIDVDENKEIQPSFDLVPASEKIESVISLGYKLLGTPYEFGSSRYNTSTFDCSDFIRHIVKEIAGITLPTNSRSQGDWVKENSSVITNWNHLKRGDLMFFMSYRGNDSSDYPKSNRLDQRITHVGMYLGDGKVLHTWSKDSGGVRVDSIVNKHWEDRFMFGGSVIK
jgi:peptidoglycan DL-endopeptidase CwlO